jgi:intein/homing endonuclease
MVHTSGGLRYIENLVPKYTSVKTFEKIFDISTINSENNLVNVSEGYYNGEEECLKINFVGERSLIGTRNHKVLVIKEDYSIDWVKFSDLKVSDYVVSRIGLECFGDCQKCFSTIFGPFEPTCSTKGSTKKIKLPHRMNRNLARLLGYIISDGTVGENGISLCQLKNNVVDDFINIIETEFNLKCAVVEDSRSKDLVNVVVNSRVLRDFIKYLGIDPQNKLVPRAIFELAGKSQTAEFIKGLTLDGFVSEGCVGVISTIKYKLAKQVQLLLEQFGIDAVVSRSSGEYDKVFPGGNTYHCQESWKVSCALNESIKFTQYIGFAEERKTKESLEKLRIPSRKSLVGSVPDFNMRKSFRELILPNIKSNRLYEIFHSLTSKGKYEMSITRESLLMMKDMGYSLNNKFIDETYVFRKVESIEEVGIRKTYDLHVPIGNSYIVNGFVSHNTINLPKGTSSDVVSSLYMAAWKKGLKGVTVYVDGSRDGVLITEKSKEYEKKLDNDGRPLNITQSLAPKRPLELPCDIKKVKISGEAWTIFVGLFNNKPYEVFGGLSKYIEIPNKYKSGKIVKNGKNTEGITAYNLVVGEGDDKMVIKDIANIFENKTYGAFSRTISLAIRHGTPIQFVTEQLTKDKYSDITSFSRVIARVLKSYIKDGTKCESDKICPSCKKENSIQYQEGCLLCTSCGYSKCG